MTKQEAIQAILNAAEKQKSKAGLIQFAAGYAKAALDLGLEGESWRVQALYILNNLSGWRGEEARKVKAFLQVESKEF